MWIWCACVAQKSQEKVADHSSLEGLCYNYAYTVTLKCLIFIFVNNFFVTGHPLEVIDLPTSPVNCIRITLKEMLFNDILNPCFLFRATCLCFGKITLHREHRADLWTSMYAGHVACCPLVSHGEYADGTDRHTDRWTPDHYILRSATRGQHN